MRIREEVAFTKGLIIVRGKLVRQSKAKPAGTPGMAFIALASVAIFVNAGKSISGIRGAAGNQFSNAAAAAS